MPRHSWPLIIVLVAASGVRAQPSFHVIGPIVPGPGNTGVDAWGVSGDGQVVVGQGIVGSSTQAFRYQGDALITLGSLPGGNFTIAMAASSNAGTIVGWGGSANGVHAWKYVSGAISDLGTLQGATGTSNAFGVSRDGATIVGTSRTAAGDVACVWAGGTITSLGDFAGGTTYSVAQACSDDGGVVVGYGTAENNQRRAFRYSGAVMQMLPNLPGGGDSFASDVTPDGTVVVGWNQLPAGGERGVLWKGGVATNLGPFGTLPTAPNAVSDDGSTVVGRTTNSGDQMAIIWDAVHGWRSIAAILQSDFGLNLGGLMLTEATGISGDGRTICGRADDANGMSRAWVATIPAPGGVLMLAGCAFWCARRSRREG